MPPTAQAVGGTFHREYVYPVAVAFLGHAEDAEDVTQEMFLRVHKALPAYQADRGSIRTWLTQITVNACKTHRRRNQMAAALDLVNMV